MIGIEQWRAAIAMCRVGRLSSEDIEKYRECCAQFHLEDEFIKEWGCPLCNPSEHYKPWPTSTQTERDTGISVFL